MPTFIPTLRRLLASGHTLAGAGATLGFSKSTAHRWIERYGMDANSRRRTKSRVSPEDRAKIQAMLSRGASKRKTAATIGVGRSTVRRINELPAAAYRCRTCGGKSIVTPCRVCSLTSVA